MSRFVSAGTDEAPTERDEAWRTAQQELDSRRQRKAEELRQEGGQSLYETLQANKAAKQEAFEEAARLKNQFRSLDEDEIDFLDTVLGAEREHEAKVKKETQIQLDLFRKQQEEAEKAARQQAATEDPTAVVDGAASESWNTIPRKRKKARQPSGVFARVKLRKASATDSAPTAVSPTQDSPGAEEGTKELKPTRPAIAAATDKPPVGSDPTSTKPSPAISLGLAAYSSSEEDG